MNILLINHYAGSVKHGMEFRPFYMAREWVKQGHEVTIIAASHSHLRSKPPEVSNSQSEEVIDGVRYIWLKTPAYQGNGVKRVINMFAFVTRLWLKAAYWVNTLKPDVVIASSTYPLDMWPASRIAAKTGAKLVFEVHDLWPLSPIELGGISPRHPFMVLLQWAENYAYRKADRVVSMLPKADAHMIEHGMEASKFSYIPNGIVIEDWLVSSELPMEHRTILEQMRQDGYFLLGYAGSHGAANALETLIRSAVRLKDEKVKIVLVGQGSDKKSLQRLAEHVRADNLLFLPPVPKTSIPQLLNLMDALYIGFRRIPLYRFGISPNKLIDYMMAAKPVIHAVEAANDPIKDSGSGISIPPEDEPALVAAIQAVMNMSAQERLEMGERAKQYVMREHNYRILAQRFVDVMG